MQNRQHLTRPTQVDDEAHVVPKQEEPSPEARAKAAPAKDVLEEALRRIKTPEEAREVIRAILMASANTMETEIRQQEAIQEPRNQLRVEEAAAVLGPEETAAIILAAAKDIASASGETREALERAVHSATAPEQERRYDPALQGSLDMLRAELLKHMGPLQSLDARLFLAINQLPHPPLANEMMYGLTRAMNAGWGWILGLVAASAFDKPRGRRALTQVLPPLWFATMTVEYPIKTYFRRRRPFIDIVQAISVGKKPGTFSFPSGHSAAAFAGAWLISRHYPELTPLWYLIAATVGFSRIYLGAHYPGDVMSGALSGTIIAEVTRRIIEQNDDTNYTDKSGGIIDVKQSLAL